MNLEIRLTPYMMSGLVVVKYIRLPTSLLNNIGSIVDPSSSFLNFKPVITSVWVVLKLDILNLFKTALTYFDCDINIPLLDCWNSMTRKNFISPKSVISNSLSLAVLNYFMPKSAVNIKSSTYRKTINMLPWSLTLVYNVGSHSLL